MIQILYIYLFTSRSYTNGFKQTSKTYNFKFFGFSRFFYLLTIWNKPVNLIGLRIITFRFKIKFYIVKQRVITECPTTSYELSPLSLSDTFTWRMALPPMPNHNTIKWLEYKNYATNSFMQNEGLFIKIIEN